MSPISRSVRPARCPGRAHRGAVPYVGDLLSWNVGSAVFEFADADVMDLTGAGDAPVAAGRLQAPARQSGCRGTGPT